LISLSSIPRPGLSIGLIITGLISWYLASDNTIDPVPENTQKAHIPSYFVRDLSSTSMGPDGLAESHIETIKMVQYLDDETTEMTKPTYNFYRPNQPAWDIKSEQGWLSADGELALLSGRVTIIRPASQTTAPFKMVTSDLRVQPNNNYIETDNAVKANSGTDQIDAIGMQAWMGKPSRIKFLSNVRANYDPR